MSDSYFKQFDTKLTIQQKNAIKCSAGPVIVVAGAGSGKTSVIAHRFIYMVRNFGMAPERILFVTFTNQAAKNIEKRVKGYVAGCIHMSDQEVKRIYDNIQVMTFHALCRNILDWVYEKKDKSAVTKFVHDTKTLPILRDVMRGYRIRAVRNVHEILKLLRWECKYESRGFDENDLVKHVMAIEDMYDRKKILDKYPLNDMREIYSKFDSELRKKGLGTLDDTLLEADRFLMKKDVVKEWSSRYDCILCDEFQDVDDLQFSILTKLCSDDNNLFCVGDPDQAIYGFRGSLPKVFIKLKNHFDKLGIYTQIKKLEKNFRSTPEILKVANTLINASQVSDELRKDLFTDRDSGAIPSVRVFKSPSQQAEEIVKKIWELQKQGVRLSDIAVLGRKKSNYTRIKNALLFSSIYYEDYKETFSILKSVVVQDVVRWINIAFVRDDPESWFNSLKRVYNRPTSGVGSTTFQKITFAIRGRYEYVMEVIDDFASKNSKLMFLVRKIKLLQSIAADESISLIDRYWKIVKESGIWDFYLKKYGADSDRMDIIQKFLDSPMVSKASDWKSAFSHVEQYLNDNKKERVVCSTIHGVKGLEFKHVFLVSLSDGNIPTARGLKIYKNDEKRMRDYIDEERRVLYVAITRAKDNLYLSSDKLSATIFLQDMANCLSGYIPESSRSRNSDDGSNTEEESVVLESAKKPKNNKEKQILEDDEDYVDDEYMDEDSLDFL